MDDTTMCQNSTCPSRDSCYRYKATPSKWQSYGQFVYDENGSCAYYIEITREVSGMNEAQRNECPLDRLVGLPPVLDACCGGRMMWFNKRHPLALYMDKRRESLRWDDAGMKALEVDPDVLADFTDMPFPDESFNLVVFDPPHMATLGKNSKMAQLYGRLVGDWSVDLSEGFKECLRVLKPLGVLIFKWNESDIPLADVLRCAPIEPLFGHQTKRHGKTHWLAFIKPNAEAHGRAVARTVQPLVGNSGGVE